MNDFLRVSAKLRGPLAGEPPRLDSLLTDRLAAWHPNAVKKWEIDRSRPLPPDLDARSPPIPIVKVRVGRWVLARCSMPIYDAEPGTDQHVYVAKKFASEHALDIRPEKRVKFPTTNSDHKSYRLPLRVRAIPEVVWFAVGNRGGVKNALRRVDRLGAKVAHGWGEVESWEVERVERDSSWFAPTEHGTLLMTTLPADMDLPADLIGWRRDFAGLSAPYWHQDVMGEAIVPC